MVAGGITLFIYSLSQIGGFNAAISNLDEAGLNNFFKFTVFQLLVKL